MDTILAPADAIEKLSAPGWFLTGGSSKTKVGIPVGTNPPAGPCTQTDDGYFFSVRTSDGHFISARGKDLKAVHPQGNRSVIEFYGMQPVLQQRPAKVGGGEYTILREQCFYTFTNPALAQEVAAEEKDLRLVLQHADADRVWQLLSGIIAVRPHPDHTDLLVATFADGFTANIANRIKPEGGRTITLEFA